MNNNQQLENYIHILEDKIWKLTFNSPMDYEKAVEIAGINALPIKQGENIKTKE